MRQPAPPEMPQGGLSIRGKPSFLSPYGQTTGKRDLPPRRRRAPGVRARARLIARVHHRQLDLAQPLGELDYLLVMCAHLIVTGDEDVDEMLAEIVSECLAERRRRPS